MFSEGKENTERDMLKPHKTWDNYFTRPRWLQAGLHLYRDIVLHLEWYKTSTRWTPNPASHTQTLAEDGDYERGLNHSLLDSKCQRLELIKSQLWALSQNHASFPLHTAVTSNKPTSALQFTMVQLPNSVTKKMLSSSPPWWLQVWSYRWGTDVTQPPEKELERQRGKQPLQSVEAD